MRETLSIIKTGIAEIDLQHSTLIQCLDELNSFAGSSYGFAASFTVLNRLIDYTKLHFAFEEALLKRWNFPDVAEHAAAHQAIVFDLSKIWDDIEAGHEIEDQLILTVGSWIARHINEEDREYSKFMQTYDG